MKCRYVRTGKSSRGIEYACVNKGCGHKRISKNPPEKLHRQCDGIDEGDQMSIFPTSPPPRRETQRTDDEALAIISNHCESCENYTYLDSLDSPNDPDNSNLTDTKKHKCRKIPGCQCLWKNVKRRLWGCPIGRFTRDKQLHREMIDFRRDESTGDAGDTGGEGNPCE